MKKGKYEAVNRDQLVERLGSQCSPGAKYEGYLIGPDTTGRACHIGSYRSLAGAQTAARALNAHEETKPVCPNCGQWQNPTTKGGLDCLNECVARGFAKEAR